MKKDEATKAYRAESYGFVDSAFANNVDTQNSTSAHFGTIGSTALVIWISKGQNIVTLSST